MSNNLINYFLTNLKNNKDFKKANPKIKIFNDIHYGCKIVSPLLNDAITESVYDDIYNTLTINENKIKNRKIKKIVKKNNSLVMDYITSYKKEMENYHEELFDDQHCNCCYKELPYRMVVHNNTRYCSPCAKNEFGEVLPITINRECFSLKRKLSRKKKEKKDPIEYKKKQIERLQMEIEKLKSQS